MARIIDGRALAATLTDRVTREVAELVASGGARPGLAVVLAGEDPASEVYVRRKVAQTRKAGMVSFEHRLPADVSSEALLELIIALNGDPAVHGILVQLPLPAQIDAEAVLDAIAPAKDVDGFHPVNFGRFSTRARAQGLVPCTPLGVMMLLETVIEDFTGLDAVVVGKSNIVGKPVAILLMERDCTVSVAHIHTRNLPARVRGADIVVVAAGSPGLIQGDWVKPGAVVIDVGINRQKTGHLTGDACFDELDHAGAVTPVPGGVGPMTIACLLANTLKAARSQQT
jgi:methylenetetrahydrofolate dehydrogenase (NADP+) / methenyltetrahydrofolate cyclohydrolase